MSYHNRDNDYNRRGNDRSVNRGDNGELSITKSFNNNGGGNRYNNDNRNGGGYNNDRRGGNDNYRGGGNYNNNNNNNNNRNNNRYQGGRGGGNNNGAGRGDAPKKLPGNMMPRKEEAVPTSVQLAYQIVTRLSDFSAMTESDDLYANIKALAHTFVSVGDLKEYPSEISDLFVKCFSQLSVQTPIIASLLALVHTSEPDFTAQVADKLQARYLLAVAQDEVVTAKLLLRAVACLTSALTFAVDGPGGLVEILAPLLAALTQELDNNADTTKALRLSESAQASAYLLASTLVWAAPVLAQANQGPFLETARAALDRVKVQYVSAYALGGLQAVFSTFSPVDEEDSEVKGADRVLSVGPSVFAAAGESLLSDGSAWDSLWEAAVQAISVIDAVAAAASSNTPFVLPSYFNAHWTGLIAESLLPAQEGAAGHNVTLSFGPAFAADYAAHLAGLGAKAAHCHPSGSCTTAIGSTASSAWLRLRMNIFDAESSPDSANTAALCPQEKFAALTYLEDVVTFFDPVINEDGTKLGSMELLTTHLLAVFKLFPAGAHVEYILVELLLQLVLQRPVNPSLGTSVFRLVLELCRAAPQLFPAVVALSTNTIFQLLPDLDSGSVLEFGRWFSFHLINTQLAWPAHYWQFWVAELAEAQEAGQSGIPLFVRFVVEKISYAAIPDRVRAALPQELHSLIPAATPANCILFQENSGQVSSLSHIPGIAAEAKHLRKLIEEKTDPEEVNDWLEEVAPGASEGIEHYSASGEPFCWRGCLLLQVLLHVGAETSALSAVVGLLDRYSEPLLAQVSTEEHHLDLLAMLGEVYGGANNNSGNGYMYHYLLDEMMRRGQIGVSAAAKVLVDAQSGEWRGNPCVYQCVESLLDRATDFVRAAVAQRAVLGGGMVLDETLDLTPVSSPEEGADKSRPSLLPSAINSEEEQVDYDEDVDTEEREEGNRKRTRRDPSDANGTNADPDAMDHTASSSSALEQEHPLWAADEALKDALRSSRSVYSTVTQALQAAIVAGNGSTGGDMEEEGDVGAAVTACSLLRRTLRVFHGTERHLAHQQQQKVVVGTTASEVQAFLQQLSAQSGIDTSRWAAQIGSN